MKTMLALALVFLCSLGCGPSVADEICKAACENTGGEFVESYDHDCYCKYKLPHYKSERKEAAPQTGGRL